MNMKQSRSSLTKEADDDKLFLCLPWRCREGV